MGRSHRLAQSLYWLEYDENLDRREISGELEAKTRHRVDWVGVKVMKDQERCRRTSTSNTCDSVREI